MNFIGYLDSKVYLFDGDTGSMLGMLSTGACGNAVEFAPDFSAIYVPEMYYSRGTRGERTDIVAIYDTKELSPVGEVIIPPKRATGIPHRAYQGLSDDGRFMLRRQHDAGDVGQRRRRRARGVSSPRSRSPAATWSIRPATRSFASLCGDGTLQAGSARRARQPQATRSHSEKFFDPDKDPLTEKASRFGDTWLFFSFDGYRASGDVRRRQSRNRQTLVAVQRQGTRR